MPRWKPTFLTRAPAGNETKKYAVKKQNWMSAASAYVNENAALRCGIRMSFRHVRKPQMKNNELRMRRATK
jgi:hypothetical protein